MNNILKRFLTALVAVTLVTILAACDDGKINTAKDIPASPEVTHENNGGNLNDHITPVEISNDRANRAVFISQTNSLIRPFAWNDFDTYAPEFGFEMLLLASELEPGVEIAGIEQALAEGYDAVFVFPSSIEPIIPALMQAKEAGLIVGMFSSELPPEYQQYRDFFVGSDDTVSGKTAAEAIIAAFPNGANVIEIGGQDGHDAQVKRSKGFRMGIEGTNVMVLDSQNCPNGWSSDEAKTMMEDFIVRYGDKIDVVFCHWDYGASGAIEALQSAGMTDVFVVGIEGNLTAYQQIREGTQAVSIGISFASMARLSLQNARILLDGGTVPEVNFVPFDVVTRENIDSFPEPSW